MKQKKRKKETNTQQHDDSEVVKTKRRKVDRTSFLVEGVNYYLKKVEEMKDPHYAVPKKFTDRVKELRNKVKKQTRQM